MSMITAVFTTTSTIYLATTGRPPTGNKLEQLPPFHSPARAQHDSVSEEIFQFYWKARAK
ncbi:MAG: hypothetical protein U0361_20480 [Nitrospiraceae bacterium]